MSEKCKDLHKRMDVLVGKGIKDDLHRRIKPNSISFIRCIDAYAKIGDARNNLLILSTMEKAFKLGNACVKPTR